MAFISSQILISLLLFSLSLSPLLLLQSQAVRSSQLDGSDHKALLLIKADLGFTGQQNQLHHRRSSHLCNSAGIFCDWRVSGDSPSLRVVRIAYESRGLTGSLSPSIGRLSELKQLSLANNHLVDRISSQIVDCRKLQVLNLRNNRFSGELPPELSSLVDLRVLDLSSNRFTGDPSFLNSLTNLEELYLSDNLFSGKAPTTLRSLRNPNPLNLEAPVPQLSNRPQPSRRYSILPRRYRLAEMNSTRGDKNGTTMAPSSSSSSSSGRSSKSNSTRTNSSSTSAEAPSSAARTHHHKKRRSTKRFIFGFLVGLAAGLISGVVLSVSYKMAATCIRRMRGRKSGSGPVIFSSLIKNAEDLLFLEKEDGLNSLEVIGRGGCGEVYKAELPWSNGKMIAIKKIVQPAVDAAELTEEDSRLMSRRMRQIKSEIQTVGHIRHRNLIPLLAHVTRPDCHFLVYEYMKNGSLQDVLKQASDGEREVDWMMRYSIAMGVAEGLEYLHFHQNPKIIHRDLKPGNILLDDDMVARIADFGLAKAVPVANTHVTTSNVAGTVGYIAPEYHQTLRFTDKCDIYSYGVLLAVLVMGKLPSDEFFQHTEEMSQVKWLKNVITSENPKRAIDAKLVGNGYEEQMLLVLKIACFCTLDDAKQRPNSKDVRCMLSQLKH
ncbi:hypothetical protein Syun_024335 [Stephania yunnanensis]|uniref:Protein kinase domain-containing protein n=1 Tax=Stephania yunnanensis TaxID=152371 RepID=A0AAP0NIJ3_9MAGN